MSFKCRRLTGNPQPCRLDWTSALKLRAGPNKRRLFRKAAVTLLFSDISAVAGANQKPWQKFRKLCHGLSRLLTNCLAHRL